MKQYEINNKTVALYGMANKTRIYEDDCSFIVDKPVNEIMEDSCSYFGSSLKGRKQGTANLIGVSYKAPIIVEESNNIIFFPTKSSKINSCSWIRLSKILRYYRRNDKLIIEFQNGDRIPFNTTYSIINNQVLRATRLEAVLNNRKLKEKESDR